jgi:intracellular multiplication protein IcmE
MTNDENDIDIDIDGQQGQEPEPQSKPTLKDAWESNPMMKIAAFVLGGAILIGGYMTFVGDEQAAQIKSVIGAADFSVVKQAPGQKELDPEYQKATQEQSRQRAQEAATTGGSSLPTPIGTTKGTGLNVPEMESKQKSDPLEEWRRAAEAKRMAMEEKVAEEDTSVQPDIVPMVQPVRPQPVVKMDSSEIKRLSEQMRVIIAAQAPTKALTKEVTKEESLYMKQRKEAREQKDRAQQRQAMGPTQGRGESSGEAKVAEKKIIVPAGQIAYGQLLTELNSDIAGPALVQVLSGPFEGGRALGKVEVKEEYLVITFQHVVKDGVSYKVDAIALDEKTTLAGQVTDVDHHYFTRIILPAAAKFIEGYGSAVAETGQTTTTTSGGGVASNQPKPDTREQLFAGIEEASKKAGEIVDQDADRPITVRLAKGTTMGVLFMESVTTGSVE